MKLMILDGNSVINRAYFGVKPLTTRDGLYTHAVYGFLNILERMEKEESPDAVCVAFDLHGPTFRHERYEGYKANRHGMPEELAQQMPVMKQSVPQVQYWVGVNGQQAGPFDWSQLQQLVQQGQLTQQTYVWKQGMANWEFAANVQELLPLFANAMPQMPGMPPCMPGM